MIKIATREEEVYAMFIVVEDVCCCGVMFFDVWRVEDALSVFEGEFLSLLWDEWDVGFYE